MYKRRISRECGDVVDSITMLRKVYLTSHLPETSALPSPKTLPDVAQKMVAFQREKHTYKSDAPTLRPNPLEKYDRRDVKDIEGEDRDEEILADEPAGAENMEANETLALEDRYAGTIASLPKYVQRRAWRLLPFLLDKDLGGGELNMRDVLYDLTVKNVKRIHSQDFNALRSLYRQLDRDVTLPKSYYVRKLDILKPGGGGGEDGGGGGAAAKQSVRASILPSPPGQKNLPVVASTPRRDSTTPIFHSKATTPGTRSYGEDAGTTLLTSTPLASRPIGSATLSRKNLRKQRQRRQKQQQQQQQYKGEVWI